MKHARIAIVAGFWLATAMHLYAGPLPCKKTGVERWPVKVTVPSAAAAKKMTLDDALKLAPLTDVKRNDKRYQDQRILNQAVKENMMVTLTGWLYLVAFEYDDDCDFHIQLTTKPITGAATKDDNSMIVELPAGEYATSISSQVEAIRQWIIDRLLAGKPPKPNSVHVMQHPVYVKVTGALFYDDAHTYQKDGTTGRGKKGLQSKTLWELHPITAMAFAPKPRGSP
jgi:hypothetical protein